MALGIVSLDEFDLEINRFSNDENKNNQTARIENINRGRGEGNTEVPDALRKIIGETAIEVGNKETLAELAGPLGISSSSMTAYKNGARSTASYDSPAPDLKKHVDDKRVRISNKAKSRLMHALNEITPDKLKDVKARDLAGIAKDMAVVVRQMEPESVSDEKTRNIQFVFFAPQVRKEESFGDFIEVNE